MPDTSTRRLAAIMFTGIAGYTAMMQHDEQDALQKPAFFRRCLETKTAEFKEMWRRVLAEKAQLRAQLRKLEAEGKW